MSGTGPSWIRRRFYRMDDFVLWCVYIVWIVVQITTATAIVTAVARAVSGA